MKNTMRILMTVTAALLVAVGAAQAQFTAYFTNTLGGSFNDPNNWNPNQVPLGTVNTNAVFAQAPGTYTVTWSASATNYVTTISNKNQNVTWDLGGKTYQLYQVYSSTALAVSPNAGETNNLTIMNGVVTGIRSGFNAAYMTLGAGSTVLVTNNGRAIFNLSAGGYLSAGGTLTVTGPGSYWGAPDTAQIQNLFVLNGAAVVMQGGTDLNFPHIDGGTMTNRIPMLSVAGDRIEIVNGGKITQQIGGGAMAFGQHSGGANVATGSIGRASDSLTSVMESAGGIETGHEYLDNRGIFVDLVVNSNGVLRITTPAAAQGGGMIMYTNATTWGRSDLYVDDQHVIDLNGGRIELVHSNYMDIASKYYITGYLSSGVTNPATLRGYGTIAKTDAGYNYTLRNDGWIKPGDTGSAKGIGTITMIGGNLLQTNALAKKAGLYFEFSNTANDQINIQNGFARITSGSNYFALAAGAPAPTTGVKYGLGTYDFIIGTNVTYTPAYDNLVNLLTNTYHLTYGVDFQYGVVSIGGGLFALELTFVPEPSTVLLLALGGLMVWRRMAKRTAASSK